MPRILVVDDDPVLRAAIRVMLDPLKLDIEEASDGREALRILRARPADVVLCDLFMPEKDGLEVLRELSGVAGGPRVVMMSGGGSGGQYELLPAAEYLGAVAVLPKPFKQVDLLEAVRRALPSLPTERPDEIR